MREGNNHVDLVDDSWLHDDEPIKNRGDDDKTTPRLSDSSSSIGEESMDSDGCSVITSSSDTADDASSPLNSTGDLFDLSEIMCQLPIKRGLSKFYEGKTESLTSFSKIKCIEDLQKKTIPYVRNARSCGNGLSYCSFKAYTRPRGIISKKTIRRASFLSTISSKRQSSMSTKPPMNPLHNNFEG